LKVIIIMIITLMIEQSGQMHLIIGEARRKRMLNCVVLVKRAGRKE